MSTGKFKELKMYLKALPESLPISGPFSKINCDRLQEFVLDRDEDWVNDVGIEGAVNREIIEAALGDFLPQNNDGIFYIKERGPTIEALADVLKQYHDPGCALSAPGPLLQISPNSQRRIRTSGIRRQICPAKQVSWLFHATLIRAPARDISRALYRELEPLDCSCS
jgi:hypothetical protein